MLLIRVPTEHHLAYISTVLYYRCARLSCTCTEAQHKVISYLPVTSERAHSGTLGLDKIIKHFILYTENCPRPGHFTPGKESGTHCIGSWVVPSAGVDGCGKSHPIGIFSSVLHLYYFFVLTVLPLPFCPYCATHTHNTNIHVPGRNRTRNPSAIGRRPSP